MGLFDTIINIKNLVTGGSAEVHLELSKVTLGEPFKIRMRADVADNDLKIDGAFLEIQGIEEIEVPHDIPKTDTKTAENQQKDKTEIIRKTTVTSEQKITMAEKMELKANEEYVWDAVAELASHNQPVYKGKYCTHTYRVKAYLDCYGNDPDSGWVSLDIE